jgi:hypothetical protein
MRHSPFAIGDQHGETRWRRCGLSIRHPRELVKSGDEYGIVIDDDRAPFADRVLVAAVLEHREVFPDPLRPFRDDRADRSEKDRVRRVSFDDRLGVIRRVCRRPPVDRRVRFLRWTGDRRSRNHQERAEAENMSKALHYCLHCPHSG